MIISRALIVFSALCTSAVGAQSSGQTAPVAAQSTQPPSAAPSLGRMFYTPAERAALDELRRRPAAVAQLEAKPLPPPPEYVTLNGILRRSDGATTIWLNNRALAGRRTAEGLEVSDSKRMPGPGNLTVHVPQAGRHVDMRVGQQLEVTSGKVQERYQVAPRARAPSSEDPGAEARSTSSSPVPRRPARDREMSRERLRESDAPSADRSESAPAAKD